MENRSALQTADYVVITMMLIVPLGIGMFFAVRDAKKVTRNEYLLGGRNMSMLPVTLSIFVTFQSAISLIGMPSEIYQYGPNFTGFYIGVGISFVIAYFTLTPLMYPLQLTSVYEYLEKRYDSQFVRLLSTVMGMLQTFFYLAVALLAPGLALESAAGIPLWLSVIIVGSIGTVYTAAGGIKSVVWTDAFQTIVVFTGIFAVMIKSCIEIGGVQKTFETAELGGRTNFKRFSPDIRVRNTVWATIIGGTFTWMTNLFGQSTVQRISSMRSLRDARKSMLINIPVNIVYGLMLMALGWCMFAYLNHIRCDPYQAGLVNNSNQMTPFFVAHAMYELPGMAGLYMSSLFSGALSTLSSGINSLAANTVEDLLKKPLKSVSEKTATTITKITVFFYGMAIMVVVYLAKSLQGPVTQIAVSAFGTFGSCVFGMFFTGCCVPWANKYGAVLGGIVSLSLNLWMVMGSRLYGRSAATLEPAPSDQCFNSTGLSSMTTSSTMITTMKYTESSTQNCTMCNEGDSLGDVFFLYAISYEWYSVIGAVISIVVGLMVSRITRGKASTTTDPKLILPFLRKFWGLHDPEIIIHHTNNIDSVDGKCLVATEI